MVMPVYNREQYVHHAIQSILDQTFSDWELIIVNDGSTDNTERVVKLFKDNRIRYFKNKSNKGISYSRNLGNSKAKGEIIVVQDSDDMSLPDRLEEIWKTFEVQPHTDILYHWFYIRAVDIHYGARAIHRELNRCGAYDKQKALTVPYIPGQMAYRAKVAKKVPYRLEVKCWDDWLFICEASIKDYHFTELQRPLYEYVVSADSVTTMSDNTDLRDRDMEAMKKILRKEYGLKFND